MAEIKPWDTAYEVPEKPVYDPVIRKLKTSDPANADTIFNPLIQQIINNVEAVKQADDTRANADLSNVSKETFKTFVEETGVTGADGSVAAKDLSNVSKADFQAAIEQTGIAGSNGNLAAKDLSNVTKTDLQAAIESTGVAGPNRNVAAKDLSNVSMEDFKVFVDSAGITGPGGNVAAKPIVTEVTLTTAKWTGSATPYTQAVTVNGVVKTASSESLLYIAPKQVSANLEAAADCGITATALAKNSVTFTAAEGKPAANVVFQIINAGEVAI